MGRYSVLLAPQMADLAGVSAGQRVLDVGCGPGALTAELVARLGPAAVTAVDPSKPFVAAARARHPGVNVLQASAEHLPFADGKFADPIPMQVSLGLAFIAGLISFASPCVLALVPVWEPGARGSLRQADRRNLQKRPQTHVNGCPGAATRL
jgi:SAM-dependent methyltransferase